MPLEKGIYGLKQVSHAWNLQFHGVLLDLGFMRMHYDAGIYHHLDDGGTTIIILYVDDITILSDSPDSIKTVKSALFKQYEMIDLGEISSYLGVNIKRNHSNKQLEIVNHFGLSDANLV
jgi:hypothetical protein